MLFYTTFLVCMFTFSHGLKEGPVVSTEYGLVRGTVRYTTGVSRPVYSYFGVQYGRAPDYVFRFRPAEEPWDWEGVRDATDENRPLCVQDRDRYESLQKNTFFKYIMPDNPNMSENCLVLDVFTPKKANDTSTNELLPVILWIHGGSFDAFGSSTKLWALSAFEDVVLVQVQYRLGLFGFLTTEDKWAPPNVAFHDQIKAMKWIQNNIRNFGGDPESVTLMGESAGSVSVTSHMLIPESKGLFHRAIAMSGTPDVIPWKVTYGDAFERLVKSAKCNFGDNAASSTCLRNKVSTSKLMKYAKDANVKFGILDDRNLFPAPVTKLIESGSFSSPVPLLTGVVSGEQNYLLTRKTFREIYSKGPASTREELESALKKLLSELHSAEAVSKMSPLIVQEYMGGDKNGMSLFSGFLDAIADFRFVSKAAKFARKVKETGQDVYFYEFTHKPSMYSARPDEFVRPYNFSNADHADDLLYFFGFPFISDFGPQKKTSMHFTKEEQDLSRNLMKIIARFAKNGAPPVDMDWPQYPGYVQVGLTELKPMEHFRPERTRLWNRIYEIAQQN